MKEELNYKELFAIFMELYNNDLLGELKGGGDIRYEFEAEYIVNNFKETILDPAIKSGKAKHIYMNKEEARIHGYISEEAFNALTQVSKEEKDNKDEQK